MAFSQVERRELKYRGTIGREGLSQRPSPSLSSEATGRQRYPRLRSSRMPSSSAMPPKSSAINPAVAAPAACPPPPLPARGSASAWRLGVAVARGVTAAGLTWLTGVNVANGGGTGVSVASGVGVRAW